MYKLPIAKVGWMLTAAIVWLAVVDVGETAMGSSGHPESEAANLVVNGSFDGDLEGWSTWTPRGAPQIAYDGAVYRTAPGAARLQGFSTTDRAALVQRPAVEAGKWYTISAWVKTENVRSPSVYLRVQFNSVADLNQKTRDHLILGRLRGTNDWTLLEETFLVPSGTGSLTIEPFLDAAYGIVWWDDIRLVEADVEALAVKDLRAETLASGAVQLTWSIDERYAGSTFRIYRSETPAFDESILEPIGVADRTAFVDRNTLENKAYYYKVVPIGLDGAAGEASETLAATVSEVAGVRPVQKFHAEWTARGVQLTWEIDGFARAQQIRLERGTAGDDGAVRWSSLGHVPHWMTAHVDTSIPDGIPVDRVWYRASVISPEGEVSEAVQARVGGVVPRREPAVPVGQHPRLFVTAEEIQSLKEAARVNPGVNVLLQNNVINPARQVAQSYLSRDVQLPEKGNNARHQALAGDARRAAFGYAFTGDVVMAEAAKKILLAYASEYRNYPLRLAYDGRVTTQTLDESPWLIELAWAYDLILGSGVVSDEERTLIERDLLWNAVSVIERYARGRSNWQAWHNAAIGAVAFVLNDARWINIVIDGPQGFTYHIREGLRDDGLWWEQSIGYHDFTRRALVYLAEAAWRNGYDLYSYTSRGKSLKLAFDAVFYHAFTDGLHPVVGNTSPSSRLQADWTFALAMLRYGDPRYVWLWKKSGSVTGGLPAILYTPFVSLADGADSLNLGFGAFAPAGVNLAGNTLFEDTGMGILRAQTGSGERIELAMLYKPHGTEIGHQGPDNLTIMLEGPGGRWLSGPGSYNYDVPEQGSWYKQSVSRNGVVVDEMSQYPQGVSQAIFATDSGRSSSGELRHFVAMPSLGVMTAATDRVYDDVAMERTVLLTGDYVIDRYVVKSPRERQYDWVLNVSAAEESISIDEEPRPGTLGRRAGYEHIDDARAGETGANWHATWTKPGAGAFRVTMLGSERTQVIRGRGLGPSLTRQPVLIARRNASETEFVSVMEVMTGGTREGATIHPVAAPGLKGVEVARDRGGGVAVDRMVWKTAQGTGGDSAGDAGDGQGVVRLASGERFAGELAYFRAPDERWEGALVLVNGTMAEAGAVRVETNTPTDLAVQWTSAEHGAGLLAGAVVGQFGREAVRVRLVMPSARETWRVFRLTPEGEILDGVAGEPVEGARADHLTVSWVAEPGTLYVVAAAEPDRETLRAFAIEVR